MPTTSTTYIVLSEDELEQRLRDAAIKGARYVSENLREKVAHLDRAARVEIGLITIQDLCALYGVSERTVHNWPIEPADTPTQRNYYRVSEIERQLTGASDDDSA